ncbi:MAG: TonB-dependent receptor, partial [Myxococcales bacterium]|nr:TonB-dependent receptor [Myxococcales bacterium]
MGLSAATSANAATPPARDDHGRREAEAGDDDARDATTEGGAGYRTVIRSARRDPQRRADRRNPGFVTAIDVAAQDGARPADDLPQLLGEQAATRVRSLGGLGQYSAVSIRGSTSQQVSFYIDGVPLGQSLSGLVNPSDLPLDGLDSVELYRGYLPLAFGAAIGGAIHLVTDHRCQGPTLRAIGGAGSFAAHEARVAYKREVGRFCVDARVGVSGAAGGFTFLDTNGTPQNPDDDRYTRRLNNHYERVVGQVGFAGRRGRWRIRGRELLFFKRQGIPGPGHAQARQTELDTLTARSLLSVSQPTLFGPGAPLTWVAGVGVERRHFRDPLSEVGLGVDDERLLAGDLYVSPRVGLPLWTGAKLDLLGEARGE